MVSPSDSQYKEKESADGGELQGGPFPQGYCPDGGTLVRRVSLELSPYIEELMEERRVEVDHSTIQRWVVKYSPPLEEGIPSTQASGVAQLADGRDLHQDQRPVVLLVSHRRQIRRDDRLSAHGAPRYRGRTVLSEESDPSPWCPQNDHD